MKKYLLPVFHFLSGGFVICMAIIEMYNDKVTNLSATSILVLIISSVLISALGIRFWNQHDQKMNRWGIFFFSTIIFGSIVGAGIVGSLILVYFDYLFIGFVVLFYSYREISTHNKTMTRKDL